MRTRELQNRSDEGIFTVDWADFLGTLDGKSAQILGMLAEGWNPRAISREIDVTCDEIIMATEEARRFFE